MRSIVFFGAGTPPESGRGKRMRIRAFKGTS